MHRSLSTRHFVLSLALLFAFAASAAGQSTGASSAPPAGTKVGIVNAQEAIYTTGEGKKELDVLQKRFGPKQSTLKAQNDDVEKLKSALQTQLNTLTEAERAKRTDDITIKQKSLQRDYEDFQAEVQRAEQEVTNRLGQKMLGILETYAKKNGFGVILDVSNPQVTSVLWAAEATNITKDLVAAYDAANPVAAPAPAAAPKATPPAKKP